ncbi:MAG: PilX N-terminal domain-containing pilus assembly protein [Candidatus Yanofskybacteria bacterium]|nr:PilX N-terminal domain-containing pilus assembly protein [Candidatus Yanofskybacteria bacterium]
MKNRQKGFVALYLALLVLFVLSGIGVSAFLLISSQQRIIQNTRASLQAYYGAEAGVEDALLRIAKEMSWPNSYSLQAGTALVNVSVSPIIGGIRTITGQGDVQSRIRKVRAAYGFSSEDVSFNFGAHIGNPSIACPPSCGGLEMQHNDSEIIGNVFSNANIFGTSSATITDSVVIAGAGNTLEDVRVNGNVETYNCTTATIDGDLIYNSLGANTCDVAGSTSVTADVTPTVDFPITPTMIADWKAIAQDGGIVDGGGDVDIDEDRVLGPGKITGNLTIANNMTLTLLGTLWVTGTFVPGNKSVVELDDNYGDLSGALIIDQTASISNNVILRGSGAEGSFLLVIGTSSSLAEASPAIGVGNNADSAVMFAPNGVIVIQNNASLVEVTAHKILIKNATVTYDLGLSSAKFTTGPGGGWELMSWKEVE